jgi:hypothetical protein
MTINRNNYEEFFLLYVDNELCAQEKNAVDVFLTENPDLQEEMVMLRQSILIPDEFVFADKQSLLKQHAISDEMQAQLVLMLDNELDKNTTGKLLDLVKKDAAVKQEWEILQQTKLSAEEKIIFKDKAILYKKEGGRVISIKWWRIAAAALVIGFGIWGVLNYSGRSGGIQPNEIAKRNAVKPAATPIIPANVNEQPVAAGKNSSIDDATVMNETKQDEQVKSVLPVKTKNSVSAANKQKPVALKQSNDLVKEQEIKTNNLPKPSLGNINNPKSNNNDVATVTYPDNNSSKGNDVVQPDETITANSFAVQTNYIDSENENEDNNKSRKNKIGGFFKKLKRVVERKTNTKSSGDNSFKIANMSFAMQ